MSVYKITAIPGRVSPHPSIGSSADAGSSHAEASASTSRPSTYVADPDHEIEMTRRGIFASRVEIAGDGLNDSPNQNTFNKPWAYVICIPVKYQDSLVADLTKLLKSLESQLFEKGSPELWANVEIVIGINAHCDAVKNKAAWWDSIKALLPDPKRILSLPINIRISSWIWGEHEKNELFCHGALRKAMGGSTQVRNAVASLSKRYIKTGALNLRLYVVSMDQDFVQANGVLTRFNQVLKKAAKSKKTILLMSPGITISEPQEKTWDVSYLASQLDFMSRVLMFRCHPRIPWYPEPCTGLLIDSWPSELDYRSGCGKDGRFATLKRLANWDYTSADFTQMVWFNRVSSHSLVTGIVERMQWGHFRDRHEGYYLKKKPDQPFKVYRASFEAIRAIETVSMSHQMDINFASHVMSAIKPEYEIPQINTAGEVQYELHNLILRLFNLYHPTSYILGQVLGNKTHFSYVTSFRGYLNTEEKRKLLTDTAHADFFTKLNALNYEAEVVKNPALDEIAKKIHADIIKVIKEKVFRPEKRIPQYVDDILTGLLDLCIEMGRLYHTFLKTHIEFSRIDHRSSLGPIIEYSMHKTK